MIKVQLSNELHLCVGELDMKQKIGLTLVVTILLIQLINPVLCQNNETSTNSDTSMNILSVLLGILGVVGTFYSYYSYRANKKDKEINRVIFEAASKSLDKTAIEDEIEDMKKQKDNYAIENRKYEENIKELKGRIEKEIPHEAKRAVLKGKMRTQEELLLQTYDSLLSTKKELNGIGEESQISPEIQKMVENEIRPEYVIREEQSKRKNYVIYLTTGASISSSLLPYPFNGWITKLLLLFALFLMYDIFVSSHMSKNITKNRLINTFSLIIDTTFILSLIMSVFILGSYALRWTDDLVLVIIFLLMALAIFILPTILISLFYPELVINKVRYVEMILRQRTRGK